MRRFSVPFRLHSPVSALYESQHSRLSHQNFRSIDRLLSREQMFKFLKDVVSGSGAGVKDLPYNIGEPYSSAWGSWTHSRGTSKVTSNIYFFLSIYVFIYINIFLCVFMDVYIWRFFISLVLLSPDSCVFALLTDSIVLLKFPNWIFYFCVVCRFVHKMLV